MTQDCTCKLTPCRMMPCKLTSPMKILLKSPAITKARILKAAMTQSCWVFMADVASWRRLTLFNAKN